MKNIFISFLAALSLSMSVYAQEPLDKRIDAALDRMPAENMEAFNSVMTPFTSEIPEFVEILSARLVPASEGKNAKVEYLLNGFISYLSSPANSRYRAEAAEALEKAIAQCSDKPNRAFLQECLYLLSQYSRPAAQKGMTLSQAKAQLRKKESHLKTEALAEIFDIQGAKALPYVIKAMKSGDRQYRMAALKMAEPYTDEAFLISIAEILKSGSVPAVKADIIRWFGAQHINSQTDIIAAAAMDEDKEVAQAAIVSLGRIGGPKALETLMECLGGSNDACAYSALLSFNGEIGHAVMKALETGPVTSAVLKLAEERKIYKAYDRVYALLSSGDESVSAAAYDALSGVATAADFHPLCDLLETSSGANAAKVQKAVANVVRVLPSDVCLMRMDKAGAEKKALYYPVLAEIGDTESIAELMKGYEGEYRQSALTSLLAVDNGGMKDILYGIALSDKENADKVLDRYVTIVNKYLPDSAAMFEACTKALQLNPSDKVVSKLLKALSGTMVNEAIFVAVPYLGNEATAKAAAETIRKVAAKKIDSLSGEKAAKALEAAREQYRKGGSADDGYAVDEINTLLEKLAR